MKIKNFKEHNLKISWTLIDIGFKGSNEFANELSTEDILDYAMTQMYLENEKNEIKEIIEMLACEYKENSDEINKYIIRLTQQEKTIDRSIEFRKWIYMYVYNNLKKDDDYIKGLIRLNDIWVKCNFPKHSPHIIQGLGNNIVPQEYYTMGNYIELYKKHLKWLENERRFLQEMDKQRTIT